MATESDSPFGQIITFYSYKGGTGRSMSLANIAYLLATDTSLGPKRVLMIDWDLEAPGLHRFFERDFVNSFGQPEQAEYGAGFNRQPGLIDYLERVRREYEKQSPNEDLPSRTLWDTQAQKIFHEVISEIPLDDYVLETDLTGLYLLKAGRGDEDGAKEPAYADTVRGFDWERFYTRFGSFLELWREELMNAYDYVLIDSRTGLTDTSGICTRVMPEKLVAVFVPNRQNIDGTIGVVRSAVGYRMQSRDPRALFTFPLASRIDAAASKLRTIWLRGGELEGQTIVGYQKRFEDLFRDLYGLDKCDLATYFADTQVPHDSDYAYGERIAARADTSDKLSIGHACRTFADYLVNYSSPWERSEVAPPRASAAEPDAALTRAVKQRAWHELPRLLSLPTLIQIREELRSNNLHDTEEPSLPRETTPKPTRDHRTIDGSGNDPYLHDGQRRSPVWPECPTESDVSGPVRSARSQSASREPDAHDARCLSTVGVRQSACRRLDSVRRSSRVRAQALNDAIHRYPFAVGRQLA